MTNRSGDIGARFEENPTSGVLYAQARPNEGTDLKDLVRILRRRRTIVITTVLGVTALVAVVTQQMTPYYTTTAAVVIEPRESRVVDMQAVLEGAPQDDEFLQTQVNLISSSVRRVVAELDLASYPHLDPAQRDSGSDFQLVSKLAAASDWLTDTWLTATGVAGSVNPTSSEACEFDDPSLCDLIADPAAAKAKKAPSPEAEAKDPRFWDAVKEIENGLRVQQIEKSYVIRISGTSADPRFAADMANRTAELYVRDQLDIKREATSKAVAWLSARVAELHTLAQHADEAVQSYRAEHGLFASTGARLDEQQLTDLHSRLIGTQIERAATEAKLHVAQQFRDGGSFEALAEVFSSPMLSELRRQAIRSETEETQLLQEYGERHPRIVQLRAEKEDVAAKINQELRHIARSLESEIEILRTRERAISENLATAKAQSQLVDQAELELVALESEAKASRSQHDAFLKRLKEVREQTDLLEAGARIVLNAEIPPTPAFPRPKLMTAAGFVGSLFVAGLLAFVREYFDSSLRSGQQVERAFGIANLGYVPLLRSGWRREKPHAYLFKKPRSIYAEAIEAMRLAIELQSTGKAPQVVLVTSSVPNEGKTTLAISLAISAARSGLKAVVVDLDLRHPSLHRELNLDVSGCLFSFMMGETPLEEVLYPGADSVRFDVLPLRRSPARPLDLLRSEKMAALLRELRSRYDYIVLDTAPLLGLSDSVVAARLADAIVLAVRWGKTKENMVRNSAEALLQGRVSITGAVLTLLDPQRHKRYAYGDPIEHYGKYKKYYLN